MAAWHSRSRAQEAAAASDLADIGEDISMEEVLGPGTHRSRSPTKKPRPTFQNGRARRLAVTSCEYLDTIVKNRAREYLTRAGSSGAGQSL